MREQLGMVLETVLAAKASCESWPRIDCNWAAAEASWRGAEDGAEGGAAAAQDAMPAVEDLSIIEE
jgi:hypothetical protein